MSGVVWQSSLSASQSTASQKAVAHISMRLQYFLGEASIKASQPISQVSRRQLLTSVQLRHDKVTSCHFVGEIGIGFLAKDGKLLRRPVYNNEASLFANSLAVVARAVFNAPPCVPSRACG